MFVAHSTIRLSSDTIKLIKEEFWYGNIEPADYDAFPGKGHKELLQLISRKEDKLLATMTAAAAELTAEDLHYIGAYVSTTASLSTEALGGIPSIPEKDLVLKTI